MVVVVVDGVGDGGGRGSVVMVNVVYNYKIDRTDLHGEGWWWWWCC